VEKGDDKEISEREVMRSVLSVDRWEIKSKKQNKYI